MAPIYARSIRSLFAILVVAFLSSCLTRPGSPDPAATVVNTRWLLTTFGEGAAAQPPIAGTQLTLEFGDDGRVAGRAGCNSFGGTFHTSGQTLTIGELQQTLMGCDAPTMEQESRYTAMLSQARTFVFVGDQLIITTANGSLQFARSP